MRKKVIAYVHTHWDREWYREFEIFRLRLLRVFDNVLSMLENGDIPSFYFDGQVCALLDYLELRPEKEKLVRDLVKEKRLFIGPFYTLVDEFLCDEVCFKKNLEIGLKIAKDFGCKDFVAYFADTFGHSKNTIPILRSFGIDKCMLWRGVPKNLPSEFVFNGINTVNMIRGYFMDIFSSSKSIQEKAKLITKELDLIAEKSGNVLLLPIGADHLGVPRDLKIQVENVNKELSEYEIVLGSPFDYFKAVKGRFSERFDNELRDNSNTFILSGCYSARRDIKQYFNKASYLLQLADDFQKKNGSKYVQVVEYAYKLLLQNLAHDGICGCSIDDVHAENIVKYKKVIQIAQTIIEELKFEGCDFRLSCAIEEFEDSKKYKESQVVLHSKGFDKNLLIDIQRIPVTEDYGDMYTQIHKTIKSMDVLKATAYGLANYHLLFFVKNNELGMKTSTVNWHNFIKFTRCDDVGDAYNFAPDITKKEEVAQILSTKLIMNGPLRCGILIKTSFFDVEVYLNNNSKMLNFRITWDNKCKNKLWQVKFELPEVIKETYSEDMGELIQRKFNPNYDIRNALPKQKGQEAKTNFAPMQRFVWANGFGIVTKGLTEYEVKGNTLGITILRSCGVISNPKNPARTTPAGPPLPLKDAQLLGKNTVEFSITICDKDDFKKVIEEIYPQLV